MTRGREDERRASAEKAEIEAFFYDHFRQKHFPQGDGLLKDSKGLLSVPG